MPTAVADLRPPDETFVLLYFPESESGWRIGFWSVEYGDYFESEAAPHSMTEFGGTPTHWEWLPQKP